LPPGCDLEFKVKKVFQDLLGYAIATTFPFGETFLTEKPINVKVN